MMPREHGAYAQLSLSLAAGLVLSRSSTRAWAQALATLLVFLASEPLLVILGRRGEAIRIQEGARARRHLVYCGALLSPALGLAWAGTTRQQELSILPGLIFGLGLLSLFLARREHSAQGELLAAAAFSCSALPVALLGEIAPSKALLLAAGLTTLHIFGTLIVRGFLRSLKPHNPRGARALPALLGLLLIAGIAVSPLPSSFALAPVPLTSAAIWVLTTSPSPRALQTMGWVLASSSALGALALLTALH